MHVRDLVSVPLSLNVLQQMTDLCAIEAAAEVDMILKAKKSAVIRISKISKFCSYLDITGINSVGDYFLEKLTR